MGSTPRWLQEKIREYYIATTGDSYLRSWSPEGLALHFGLADEATQTHEDALANTNRFLADALALGPADRCLDAGCGVGGTAIWVARERGAHVTGVNLSEHQVERAMRFAEARGVSARTTFLVMDYAAMEFDDGTFDAAWNLDSLCHSADASSYLAEVYRVLRPGGRYIAIDFFRGDRGAPQNVTALCDGWALPGLHSAHEIADALRARGFIDVSQEELTPRVLRSAATLEHMANQQRKLLDLEHAMTGREKPVYRGHTTAALAAARGFGDGSMTYHAVTARRPD
jgi:cyclopropane fatty-acyl-phospholipid synthase-like methyltransferase